MKELRGQARVTAFLRKSLAEGAQDVLKLEAMARGEEMGDPSGYVGTEPNFTVSPSDWTRELFLTE